jgi:hypothetical protein
MWRETGLGLRVGFFDFCFVANYEKQLKEREGGYGRASFILENLLQLGASIAQ